MLLAVGLALIGALALMPRTLLAQDNPAADEIVFIDEDGVLRVLDSDQTADNAAVRWRSPDGNRTQKGSFESHSSYRSGCHGR